MRVNHQHAFSVASAEVVFRLSAFTEATAAVALADAGKIKMHNYNMSHRHREKCQRSELRQSTKITSRRNAFETKFTKNDRNKCSKMTRIRFNDNKTMRLSFLRKSTLSK